MYLDGASGVAVGMAVLVNFGPDWNYCKINVHMQQQDLYWHIQYILL